MIEKFVLLFKKSIKQIGRAALEGAYTEAQSAVHYAIEDDTALTEAMKIAAHQGAGIAFEKLKVAYDKRFDG